MDLNGQIHRSIHQWQSFGVDSHLQFLLLNGIRATFGGRDGQLLGQIFLFFHQMEQLISDKVFSLCLETVIGSHKWHHVLNFLL
jgi:hypothetical protein